MESRRDRRTEAPEARRLILERRAAFMSAALTALGCAVSTGGNATAPVPASGAPSPVTPPSASAEGAPSSDEGSPPAESAPPSASAQPPAIVRVCLSIVILTRPQFAPGALDPLPDASLILDEAAAILRDRPQLRLEIAGHQDTLEPDPSRKVALARAERVRDLLVSRGIDAARLCAQAYGASRPVAPNESDAGRAKNRRVEFRVLEPNETCTR